MTVSFDFVYLTRMKKGITVRGHNALLVPDGSSYADVFSTVEAWMYCNRSWGWAVTRITTNDGRSFEGSILSAKGPWPRQDK